MRGRSRSHGPARRSSSSRSTPSAPLGKCARKSAARSGANSANKSRQSRRDWTSAELADRLGVTTRTVRNDIGRLRELGYPVEARRGVTGGYRLGTGGALPPLLLDDEEAVAIAIALRTAASASITGIEETSARAESSASAEFVSP